MFAWGSPIAWVPVLLLLAAAPTAWLGLATWRRRRLPGAAPLAAVELTSQNPDVRRFLANLEFVSQALVPVLWLMVVIEFTGNERRLRRALPWLLVVPAVTLALIFTNRWHSLVFNLQPAV